MIPLDLKERAQRLAARKNLSLGGLVRSALEATLREYDGEVAEPSLLGDDAVWQDRGPTDLAENHDDYLYPKSDG